MTTILQNAVVTKIVTATASDENYKYNVVYEVGDNGKTLNSVTINAQDKDGKYAGSMNYQNANKSVNVPGGVDTIVLSTMLDAVIAEIKANLVTEWDVYHENRTIDNNSIHHNRDPSDPACVYSS